MKSLSQIPQKALIALGCGVVSIFACIIGSVLLHQQQQYQSTHQASLAYLDASLQELSTFSPQRLITDEGGLRRFREINTAVLAQFQRIKYSNDTIDVAANPNDNNTLRAFLTDGELLLKGFGALIQSRQGINQTLQFKQRLQSEAEKLVQSIDSFVTASEQQSLSSFQQRSINQITLLIKDHHYQVMLAILDLNIHGETLVAHANIVQPRLQTLIETLTEGSKRLSNPVLRRMLVNNSESLQQHFTTSASLTNTTQRFRVIEDHYNRFNSALSSFRSSVSEANQQLKKGIVAPYIMLVLGGVFSCVSFFLSGLYSKSKPHQTVEQDKDTFNDSSSINTTADLKLISSSSNPPDHTKENTQQRKQVITERNHLIQDIQAILDGVFYVDANEHSETTGDIAKALNASRRSIVKRIQLIQQEVARLQQLQAKDMTNSQDGQQADVAQPTPNKSASPDPTQQKVSGLSAGFDLKSCVDITFETQTKIEAIRRLQPKASGEVTPNTTPEAMEHCLESLMQCQDHLRVRLRDLQQLIDQHQNKEADSSPIGNAPSQVGNSPMKEILPVDFDRLNRLINSFQLTETPRNRAHKKAERPNPQLTPS